MIIFLTMTNGIVSATPLWGRAREFEPTFYVCLKTKHWSTCTIFLRRVVVYSTGELWRMRWVMESIEEIWGSAELREVARRLSEVREESEEGSGRNETVGEENVEGD